MKKIITLAALAAICFASCSKNEVSPLETEGNAIQFATYAGNAAITKATIVDGTTIKGATEGFGVFAFYTERTAWDAYGTKGAPNFMKNEEVKWTAAGESGSWTYSPLKYWPNNVDDKVSFFAYAPYDANKAWDTSAKTAFAVKNEVKEQIDLLYAAGQVDLCKNPSTSTDPAVVTVGNKVTFSFEHALSRIDLYVAYAADQVELGGTLDDATNINVTKVTLGKEGAGFHTKGNLIMTAANADAAWADKEGAQIFTLTADNNFVAGVASKVTNAYRQLNKTDSYVMVIPQENLTTDVVIEYTVVTTDAEGVTSTVNNKITKEVNLTMTAGEVYKLNMLLGMTSVKLDVTVNGWDEDDAENKQVDLPSNK